MKKIIERLEEEVSRYEAINKKLMDARIPCWTEIEQNRGYINGLRSAILMIQKEVGADERDT